jgi:hypothetical protein
LLQVDSHPTLSIIDLLSQCLFPASWALWNSVQV